MPFSSNEVRLNHPSEMSQVVILDSLPRQLILAMFSSKAGQRKHCIAPIKLELLATYRSVKQIPKLSSDSKYIQGVHLQFGLYLLVLPSCLAVAQLKFRH